MTDHALVIFECLVVEFVSDEFAIGIARVIALDLGQHLRDRGGEVCERLVLLRREIVLSQRLALNLACDGFVARRVADEVRRAHATIAESFRKRDACAAVVVFGIPFFQRASFDIAIRAHVGDLDADRATVGDGGVPRAFLQIKRLIDRAVNIEHEVNTQVAVVM